MGGWKARRIEELFACRFVIATRCNLCRIKKALDVIPAAPSIVFLGGDSQCGSYVLRIHLAEHTALQFGGFKGRKTIELPAGEYVYVGSAMATTDAAPLANRLVRHATRSDSKEPHGIREEMLRRFSSIGLGNGNLKPSCRKNLHWNIDHLLVSCPGNKLPKFGRRVARLARRQSAGDLARSASEGNAARRDESAEEW